VITESAQAWAIPWPCMPEFYALVTHPKIYNPPSTNDEAIKQISAWIASKSLVVIGETGAHWVTLKSRVIAGKVVGLCFQHDAHELWSADRDFSRYLSLKTRNPLT
jgi:uncharacterized protein